MDGKLQGKSSAAAARAAGYAESVARKADEIIGGSPHVQAAMTEVLHEAGITDELLAERIWQGLNATIVSKKTAYSLRWPLSFSFEFFEGFDKAALVFLGPRPFGS